MYVEPKEIRGAESWTDYKTFWLWHAILAAAIAIMAFLTLVPARAAVATGLGWTMLSIASNDLRFFRIPDILSLPAVPAGLIVTAGFAPEAFRGVLVLENLGAAIIFGTLLLMVRGLYRHLRGVEGLGLGDVKLIIVAGAWTGLTGTPLVLLISCGLAAAALLIGRFALRRQYTSKTPIPFGTFLAPAIWFVWAWL